MLNILKHVSMTLAVTFLVSLTSFAQGAPATAQQAPDNYVTERNFKSKIFEVKYRDANSLASALSKLGSGFKGATISPSNEFKTLTVRDFPENIATIEEALKRLDTPVPPRPNIELHMHILIGSNTGSGSRDVPAELKDVLTELRATLNYKNYDLAASVVQRLTETSAVLQGAGIAEVPGDTAGSTSGPMPYAYYIRSVSLIENATAGSSMRIDDFSFNTNIDKDNARVQTALNIRGGEKVVVGTAAIRNRALVVVLTAKFVN
jgi:hypothetical protein